MAFFVQEDKHVKFIWFQTEAKHCLNVSWRTEKLLNLLLHQHQ